MSHPTRFQIVALTSDATLWERSSDTRIGCIDLFAHWLRTTPDANAIGIRITEIKDES